MTFLIRQLPEGVVFKVWVQPRSSKNAVAGLQGDALKVKLTAPPVEGAANKMCIEYLAKCLGIAKSRVRIVSGESSRTKHLLVEDAPLADASQRDALVQAVEALVAGRKEPRKSA